MKKILLSTLMTMSLMCANAQMKEFLKYFKKIEKIPDSIQNIYVSRDTLNTKMLNRFLAGLEDRNPKTGKITYKLSEKINEVRSSKNLYFTDSCLGQNKEDEWFNWCDARYSTVCFSLKSGFMGLVLKTITAEQTDYTMYVLSKELQPISLISLYTYYNSRKDRYKPEYVYIKSKINKDLSIDRVEYGAYDVKEVHNHYELDKNGVYVIRKQKIVREEE